MSATDDTVTVVDELAIGALINCYSIFVMTPNGSVEEKMAEDALIEMVASLLTSPNHEKGSIVVGGLLAAIFELRTGGNLLAFMEHANIMPLTGPDGNQH